MIGYSGSRDYYFHIEDADTDNIQEVIYLGRGLMWNDGAICGERMGFIILVRDLSEMWKFTKSKSAIVFADPLMFWDCRYP